jgi:hypothetical protein
VGAEASATMRARLATPFAAGSPLLDARGNLVGLVVSGVEELLGGATTAGPVLGTPFMVSGSLAAPVAGLPTTLRETVSLSELARRGEMLRALSPARRNVTSGVFAARIEKSGGVPMPLDQKVVFSRREGKASAFVQWMPQEKRDGQAAFEVYDADYRRVGVGQPIKLKLRLRQYTFTSWTFEIDRLPPSTYRVDLLLDSEPVWRGYFRVTD